ncbi:MAG TPA: acyl-CoA dehydrogenase, partial [Burkholderiales bacterium]|nr:acyl-CoA dehydrogenase [Burkholderiales bacterium]
IYEGTTGIQANDLVGRKIAYEKGSTINILLAEMRAVDAKLAKVGHPGLVVIRRALGEGVAALSEATDWLLSTFPNNMKAASAGAVPFLKLFGTVAGGWQMARAALIAKSRLDENAEDYDFYRAKIGTARFYAEHILPLAAAYKHEIVHGSTSVLALEEAQF